MKIIFDRQAVIAAIAPLMCAAGGKSTIPAIEGVRIEAKHPDLCTLTTYDLEKGVQITISAKVVEEGCYILNAQKFMQTMRVMNGEEVTLSVDGSLRAVLESGKSTLKMNALRGEDFPELPMLKSEKGFSLPADTLRSMLGKTMYAMGVNDQRNVLNGTFFEVEENQLRLVSCDSFKLAKCTLRTDVQNHNEDGTDLRYRFIVPVKTVNELYKLISGEGENEVRIYMTRKHIIFNIGDLVFFSRLVDGEYIDFDRIIIRQHKIYVTLERDALLSALDRAAVVTEERVAGSVRSHVKLQLDDGVLKILAESTTNSTYDELEVEQEGGNILIAFNNRFLIDSVRACESERVRIALSSPLTSVNIEPADGEENSEELFMLLPVRMKD